MPPIWYASLVDAAPAGAALPRGLYVVLASLAAVLLFVVLSPAQANRGRRSTTLLARILAPARALAARFWVRPRDRAVFDLVYDALPLERDFVLRTYPMIGIPIAFLLVGADDSDSESMRDLPTANYLQSSTFMLAFLLDFDRQWAEGDSFTGPYGEDFATTEIEEYSPYLELTLPPTASRVTLLDAGS